MYAVCIIKFKIRKTYSPEIPENLNTMLAKKSSLWKTDILDLYF